MCVALAKREARCDRSTWPLYPAHISLNQIGIETQPSSAHFQHWLDAFLLCAKGYKPSLQVNYLNEQRCDSVKCSGIPNIQLEARTSDSVIISCTTASIASAVHGYSHQSHYLPCSSWLRYSTHAMHNPKQGQAHCDSINSTDARTKDKHTLNKTTSLTRAKQRTSFD